MKKSFIWLALFLSLVVIGRAPVAWADTSHPRILWTNNDRKILEEKIKTADSTWQRLKKDCDGYLTGSVEYPDGADYPSGGSIGEGYQGEGYFAALLNIGSCYQALKNSDTTLAERYGAKGRDILLKMSAPPAQAHYQNPLRDDGYGIRFFGIGLALGYDWLYDALSAADRTQIYRALNHWISVYEDKGFGRQHPQGNYFAGYYAAKALSALATEGDNPEAARLWESWLAEQHYGFVQPYYDRWLTGGGWSEGWNYGPLASINMSWPVVAAKTAKGLDLIHDNLHPYSFPLDQSLNLIHFRWPNGETLDDRGKIYKGENPAAANPALFTFQTYLERLFGGAHASLIQTAAREVREKNGRPAPWQDFLWWESDAAVSALATLPLSYQAVGMNQAALRSGWDKDAVWAALVAGPYTNYGGSGEQFFDQGSLAITVGATPFVVNATGWLLRSAPGENIPDYEDKIYEDNYGSKKRSLYNIFYPGVGQLANGPSATRPSEAPSTRLAAMEDRGAYSYLNATNLQELYPAGSVQKWTRELVYLRPGTFVVYDRTVVPASNHTAYQAFHFSGAPTPAPGAVADGTKRYEVKNNGRLLGTVQTLLPAGHTTKIVDVFDSHKAYRLEIAPPASGPATTWLTVLGAGGSAAQSAAPLSLNNELEGALLSDTTSAAAVIFKKDDTKTLTLPVSYRVPAGPTTHVLALGEPGRRYAITATAEGALTRLTISADGPVEASSAGTLAFRSTGEKISFDLNATYPAPPVAAPVATPPVAIPLPLPSATPGALPATDLASVPLFHFKNKKTGVDFYTARPPERQALLKNPGLWLELKPAFRVLPVSACAAAHGLTVRRFYSYNRFRYAVSVAEKKLYSPRYWQNNGEVFCVYSAANHPNGSAPIYRLKKIATGNEYYTLDPKEAARLAASKLWRPGVVVGYGWNDLTTTM